MSHKESNDFDREQYELMTQCPGITDLDDAGYEAAVDAGLFDRELEYAGSLLDDCAAVAAMESLMQPLPEPVPTGAWIEINKTFDEKQAEREALCGGFYAEAVR